MDEEALGVDNNAALDLVVVCFADGVFLFLAFCCSATSVCINCLFSFKHSNSAAIST